MLCVHSDVRNNFFIFVILYYLDHHVHANSYLLVVATSGHWELYKSLVNSVSRLEVEVLLVFLQLDIF